MLPHFAILLSLLLLPYQIILMVLEIVLEVHMVLFMLLLQVRGKIQTGYC